MSPPNRSVVITGASTGIGLACAERLAALGWRVYAGVRRGEDGERVARAAPERIVPLLLDVTRADQVQAAAQQVEHDLEGRGLTGLVNNAGIAVGGPLEFLPIARLREQLEVNVTSQVAVTQAFLPMLRHVNRQASPGRIVFMGSVSGRIASPLMGAYAGSKFALEAIADVLRLELTPVGIAVAMVEPGLVVTPIWDKGRTSGAVLIDSLPAEARDRYAMFFGAMRRVLNGVPRHGVAPDAVADVVIHALTARRPRIRYVVGGTARQRMRLRRLLPDRLHDRLMLAVMRRLSADRS